MNLDFDLYMDQVNEHLDDLAGVTHLDLPDYDYASAWEASTSPRACADAALKAAGLF